MDDVNDDAKGGFRRIEVLTGPERRRRWSAAEKARIVGEALAPGASVSEVARRWQVCPQQVFGWRREARAGLLPLPGTEVIAADFVPIMSPAAEPAALMPDGQNATPPAEPANQGPATADIEIKLAEAVVRVTGGTDLALLTTVLRALRASAR